MMNFSASQRIINKHLLIRLALSIIVSCFFLLFNTSQASAADTIANGNCGDNVTWVLDDEYVLTISGTGDMYNYNNEYDYSTHSYNRAPWYDYNADIMQVIVNDGITSIGDYAFQYCSGAISFTIPSSVTSIGNYSFSRCSGMSKISISSNITHLGNSAFEYCTGISSVSIPEGFTSIPEGLFRDSGVSNITLPSSLKTIGYVAFEGCGNLKQISLPEGLETIGDYAFSYTGLTSITIPSTVETIGEGNLNSNELSSINVDSNNQYYKDIDGVLFSKDGTTIVSYPCKKGGAAVEYTIPEGVQKIEAYAFHGGNKHEVGSGSYHGYPMYMKSITVPEGISNLETGAINCYVTNLYLPRSIKLLKRDSVTSATNVYMSSCLAPSAHASDFSKISTVHVPNGSLGYDVNPWISGEVVDDLPTAHIWGDSYIVDKEASCTEDGSKSIHCTVCDCIQDDSVEIIASPGHKWNDEYTVDKEASCTEEGSKSIHCSVCNAIDESTVTVIPKSDHNYGDLKETKEATCKEDGTKEKICSVCDDKITEVIPATGHKWNDEYTVDKDASCTEEGSKSIHCSVCNAIDESTVTVIPKADHTYGDWKVTKEATCTEDGSKEKVCEACEDKVTEVIPATGHKWNDEYTVDKEASCKEEGSKSIHCSVCNAIDESTVTVIPKSDHNYGDWKVTKEATCTEDGSKEKVCEVCGDKVTEVIPATGHSFGDWKVTKEATCLETGLKERTCSECGEKESEIIPLIDHSWEANPTVDKAATCTEDGSQSIHCSICGIKDESTVTVIPKTGHDWNEPTYTWADDNSSVTASRTCRNDSSHKESETVKPSSEVTKAATYTEKGETTYTAVFTSEVFTKQTKTVADIPVLERISIEKATITGIAAKTYTGKALTQAPTIKVGTKTLKSGTDYKLTYKNNKNVGKATVTITGIGAYKGTISKTFQIIPKGTSLSKVTKAKKAATVKWKKQSAKMATSRITGYQIQLATDSKFTKNKKTVTVKGYSKVSKKVTGLKGGKKYYVRIRTYKTVSGTNYYSSWSKAKTVTTKK